MNVWMMCVCVIGIVLRKDGLLVISWCPLLFLLFLVLTSGVSETEERERRVRSEMEDDGEGEV